MIEHFRLFSLKEIKAVKKPFPIGSQGIYFLFHKGKLIYIGKSKDAISRIYQHREQKRFSFDSYVIYPFPGPTEMLELAELLYIDKFKPVFNRQNIILRRAEVNKAMRTLKNFYNFLTKGKQ